MLNVEPFSGLSPRQFVRIQSRDKHLSWHSLKQLKQPFTMFTIKFRCWIIDQRNVFALSPARPPEVFADRATDDYGVCDHLTQGAN